MPIDGSYGRLRAHNERFKELRRKKLERRENKIWRNSLKKSHTGIGTTGNNFYSVESEKLELIKAEIREKARAQVRKEFYLLIVAIMITACLIYLVGFYDLP